MTRRREPLSDDLGDSEDPGLESPAESTDSDQQADEDPIAIAGEPVVVPIESEIDLHSFLPEDMESVVESYLEEALRAGLTEVRIIHGKGIGVQREMVRKVLSRSPNVLSFEDAPAIFGGRGATIAVLRK